GRVVRAEPSGYPSVGRAVRAPRSACGGSLRVTNEVIGEEGKPRRRWRWLYLSLSIVTGLLGLAMFLLGTWLVVLGGTLYYLIAGALLVAGAVLSWKQRDQAALTLFGLALLLSLAWALIEIGGKGWQPAWAVDLAGRIGLLTALVIATGLAFLLWRTPPRAGPRRAALAGVLGVAAAVVVIVFVSWERTESASASAAPSPGTIPRLLAGAEAGAEWTAYGGTNGARRYSALRQITTANVGELDEAWTFRSGDYSPAEGRVFYSAQNTPIKAGDFLYTCTPSNQVFALDPATGEARWHYDPRVSPRSMESQFT